MAWYSKMAEFFKTKENPAQEIIALHEGSSVSSDYNITYKQAFDAIEVVNRGVNMIVSSCASIDFDVADKVHEGSYPGVRAKSLNTILNYRPNPYQTLQDFRTAIFTDFILEGNAFIYFDGAFMYHLPAVNTEVVPDEVTFVKEYVYYSQKRFLPKEIAHFKDLSSYTVYRGTSRLKAANTAVQTLYKMQDFQKSFFDNGAIFSLAITTDNTLSQLAKEKTIANWMRTYNPKVSGKRPVILDSGMKPVPLGGANSFRELDFDTSIKTHNVKILETLGVPPVLLDGGNQANISPNLRLFYLETVLPILRKYVSAMESLTGYDIDIVTGNVSALQPELRDIALYHSTLVNSGILTANEAREELRYKKDTDPESDKLRIPANIAGSAANPSQGGAPKKPAAKAE